MTLPIWVYPVRHALILMENVGARDGNFVGSGSGKVTEPSVALLRHRSRLHLRLHSRAGRQNSKNQKLKGGFRAANRGRWALRGVRAGTATRGATLSRQARVEYAPGR